MGTAVILNGDQVYSEELIRENARLTVRLEAERQQRRELEAAIARLKQENDDLRYQVETLSKDIGGLTQDSARAEELSEKLDRAIKDLHVVMAGGDACKICKNKCRMGTDVCKPRWKYLDS